MNIYFDIPIIFEQRISWGTGWATIAILLPHIFDNPKKKCTIPDINKITFSYKSKMNKQKTKLHNKFKFKYYINTFFGIRINQLYSVTVYSCIYIMKILDRKKENLLFGIYSIRTKEECAIFCFVIFSRSTYDVFFACHFQHFER